MSGGGLCTGIHPSELDQRSELPQVGTTRIFLSPGLEAHFWVFCLNKEDTNMRAEMSERVEENCRRKSTKAGVGKAMRRESVCPQRGAFDFWGYVVPASTQIHFSC